MQEVTITRCRLNAEAMRLHVTTFCILLLLVNKGLVEATDETLLSCSKKLSSCSCETNNGKIVDLEPLANKDRWPFASTPTGSGFSYEFSPCLPQTCGSYKDAAGCQVLPAAGEQKAEYYLLGTQASAYFYLTTNVEKNLYLNMQGKSSDGKTRNFNIRLVCDNSLEAKFTAAGPEETSPLTYLAQLESKYACPRDKPAVLSTGDILCIMLLVSVCLYLTIGILVKVFVYKESGRQILPNVSVWASIFGLIKDGFQFTFAKLMGRSTGGTYTEVK